MCQCNPDIRTPYCGKGNCVWPNQKKPQGARLDQNNHRHGMGKYALIKLRPIPTEVVTPQEVAYLVQQDPSMVDLGLKGSETEFFVIRLRDQFAEAALLAYADAAESFDPEYATEIRELAKRASEHPNKKFPR